ncbi:DnaJ domain-containing protein [Halocatena halophila]|uniref:DnaJ domain-containing protein n=1 Tax=Halocatena halophila TaxID=2814576 RepID=UPI002ED5F2B5
MSQEYYDVLGVDPDASEAEIEAAYRERVKDVHPDRNDSPTAEDEFIRVQTARDVLTDPQQRARYDHDAGGFSSTDKRAYDGTTPSEGTSTDHERTYRTRWTDRTERAEPTETRTPPQRAWMPTPNGLTDEIVTGVTTTSRGVGRFLAAVRCPRRLTPSKQRISAALVTPTGIRLIATTLFILGGTISANYLGIDPHQRPWIGFLIVVIGLLVSYASYDLLFSTPYYEPSNRQSFDPSGTPRLWPIPVINGLGLSLIGIAFTRGAPTGGLAFTAVVLLPIVVAVAISRVIRPSITASYPIGLDQCIRFIARTVQFLPLICLFIAGFTVWGFDTPGMLSSWALTGSAPWFDHLTLWGVYVGMLLNLCVGLLVGISLCWSVYAMCTQLTAAPWTDRYTNGYQIRPGAWNALVTGPFVVSVWMVIAGISSIRIPVGVSSILITQNGLLLTLFMLPSVLTGLYILRRQLEPVFHLQ